ncbi:MAG: hypothetical protein DME96_04520 [Verrucomicrobia bacterium]|nr:MAG: hypothetical protein DME96_04520 [Verrucomicrobiota bacterium]
MYRRLDAPGRSSTHSAWLDLGGCSQSFPDHIIRVGHCGCACGKAQRRVRGIRVASSDRTHMFGQLYRRARLCFWLSALIPSALFAFGHAYQASGFWELVEIFVVTGLGSLLGCWIYMRWQFNLWTVFGLHCLMNLWWELFGVADTALGGWIANAAHLLTIAVAILLTTYRDRFWKP